MERGNNRMNKIKYLLKQLIPMAYWGKYIEDGRKRFVIWNMWFGISYNVTTIDLGAEDVVSE